MALFTEKIPNKTHKQKPRGQVRDKVLRFCPQGQTQNPHKPRRTISQCPGQIWRLTQEGSSSWLMVTSESFRSLLSPARPPSPCFEGGWPNEEQSSRSSWFLQIPGLHSKTLQCFLLALEKPQRPETPSSPLSPAPQSQALHSGHPDIPPTPGISSTCFSSCLESFSYSPTSSPISDCITSSGKASLPYHSFSEFRSNPSVIFSLGTLLLSS